MSDDDLVLRLRGRQPFRPAAAAAPSARRAGPPEDIHLDDLCFEIQWLEERRGPIRDFLMEFVGEELPINDALARYLDTLLPQGLPGTLLVSNIEDSPGPVPAHYRSLLFRPVCEGPLAETLGRGGFTLGLTAIRQQGRLVVRRFEVTPHVLRRDFEARVSGCMHWNAEDRFMSPEDFERLGGLPLHRAETSRRLQPWRRYLDWKEQLIRKNQVSLPYLAWRWESESRVAFLVDAEAIPKDRCRPGLEVGAAAPPPDPEGGEDAESEPRQRRDPDLTILGKIDSIHLINPRHDPDLEDWGKVKATGSHKRILIRLDEDDAKALRKRGPPARGQLMSAIAGDLAPLNNQRAGIDRLKNSQGFCPRLADFMFSAKSASVPVSLPSELPTVRGGRDNLNENQREAVLKVMAAPDICLVQGPPGTGKTTVIAEICLRAATAGQRVLVASQANLAVDNALARLADTPAVRRLRLGDPGKVDEEFKDFLAENVIARWFSAIAEQCRQRMDSAGQEESAAAARAAALGALRRLANEHAEAARTHERRAAEHDASLHAHARCRDQATRTNDARDVAAARMTVWMQVLSWTRGEAGLPHDLSVIASDADTGELRRMAAEIDAIGSLRKLADALDALGRNGPGEAAHEEMAQLRADKKRLADSDDDADLRRLGEVNRRLRALEASGWGKATGAVHRASGDVYGDAVPFDISVATDSLSPNATVLGAAGRSRAEVQALLDLGGAALRERADQGARIEGSANASAEAMAWTVRERDRAREALERARTEVEATREATRRASSQAAALLHAWGDTWRALLDVEVPAPGADTVARAERYVAKREAEGAARRARSRRWQSVQGEWLDRLSKITQSDRDQLQALYVRQANVVGMTCNEAGKRKTWQDKDFKPFDIVIVDEVSKATPPELILPMLLGRKVVLVGDHRQLPPMFRERDASFGEAREDGQISEEDFNAYRRMVTASLFEELFEQADNAIKATLWTQYRMHPHIMDVVNQFYDGRLLPGPDRETLAAQRPHHLTIPDRTGGQFLEPRQHLLWIDSSRDPQNQPMVEEQVGSGKRNILEVELVVQSVVWIGRALVARGYTGDIEVEVPRQQEGASLRDTLGACLAQMPEETLDDLFAERRVRIDGRAQKADRPARAGQVVLVQARREVGVLTFYGAQLKAIRETLDDARRSCPEAFVGMDLRTNTVDQFQGMEKPIIIASLVRSKKGKLGDFVREYQRINVGLSRAQQLLVIVGATDTWRNAQVPLPPVTGGPSEDRPVYAEILAAAAQSGGRRVARQLLKQ